MIWELPNAIREIGGKSADRLSKPPVLEVVTWIAINSQRQEICPTEKEPVLVPVQPRTWDEWLRERKLSSRVPTTRRSGKRGNVVVAGQLTIWSTLKEK